MPAGQSIEALSAIGPRTPGSDAERRAALWLAGELRRTGRAVRIDTFWCRPDGALAGAWHLALALAGSLVSVSHPAAGLGLLAAALLSLLTDPVFGLSPGRRLTPERASQDVVAAAPATQATRRLRIEATLSTPRAGLLRASWVSARALRGLGGLLVVWLLALAGARLHGWHGTVISVLQLVPTVVLVLGLAGLLDTAASPAPLEPATAALLALALARALDAAPPAHLAVDVVLLGAEPDRRRHTPAQVIRLTDGDTLVGVLERIDALDARPAGAAPIPA